MARTPSTMLPIGTKAPDFELPGTVDGTSVALSGFSDAPALLIMFICNHCPFVVHVLDELTALTTEYLERGVAIVGINANSLESHPQDGPAHMKGLALERNWGFPYLFDESQEVAKAYQAACTPDFFLFDNEQRLVYRGQLDDSRPGTDIPVTGADLRRALDDVLAGNAPLADQRPSLGCNIKWTPGNEPDYFG